MAKQPRFNFSKFQSAWEAQKRTLPVEVARKAENHFKEGFRLGGFIGDFLQKWAPRKKADPGRAILVKSGRLKRGIRSVPGSNFQEIKIANDVPYAKAHNEGTSRLPKRKFMGISGKLNSQIKTTLIQAIRRSFS